MKLGSAHGFVNQLLVAVLLTIGFGGSVGVGTVWLRHQISVVADDNRDLEQRRHDIERRIDDVTAQVESALSPDALRAQNQLMQLGLVEVTQSQIDPVPVDPIARLVARANRRVFMREGATNPITIQLNLSPSDASASLSAPAKSSRNAASFGGGGHSAQLATNP